MNVELRGITKRFGSFTAVNNVNLQIRAGEVLGLLGENGAGKSTLMNVLCGLYAATEGQILIDGNPVSFAGPGEAIRAGIGMVHQHFMLIPVFTVAENVVLGVEPTGPLDHLDLVQARAQVREINDAYGLEVDPDALIETLPVGVQQRVEIIKVLFRSADLVIFDEPTAVLTPQEVVEFFAIVRTPARQRQGHRLHHPQAWARSVKSLIILAVLRRGEIVGHADHPDAISEADLAELMVGRPVSFDVKRNPNPPGEPLLEVADLTVLNNNDDVAVDDISLMVRSGEIVGIAGVQGNGQSALVEALTGLTRVAGGTVSFKGKDITRASARERHRMGFAHIPEDRQRTGLIPAFSIAENMVLDSYYDDRFSTGPTMRWDVVNKAAAHAVVDFDVRTTSVFDAVSTLSGGNQQKVIVAREMFRDTEFLIASQPTRGLDVGSIEYIHSRIAQARDEGDGVLIVSSELDEILALSDRILVMFKGRIVAEFDGATADKATIGLAMAGRYEGAAA